VIFLIGFVVLLADGGALIWLGQLSGNVPMVSVGVALTLASALLVLWYRRWTRTLADVDDLRRDLRREVDRLRDAVAAARDGRQPED
jgi:membrane protein implicated in regulation of membrane protease activity